MPAQHQTLTRPRPFAHSRSLRTALTLFLAGAISAAYAGDPSSALSVRLRPALGASYRPGAWVLVHAEVDMPPRGTGVFVPALVVRPSHADAPRFISRLPPVKLAEGRTYPFAFWILAGEAPPALQVRLESEAGRALLTSESFEGVLTPLPAGRRLILSPVPLGPTERYRPRDLPHHPALLESCDSLVLGRLSKDMRPERLEPAQFDAIVRWMALGGVVLALGRSWEENLAQAAQRCGLTLSRPAPFVLPAPRRLHERQQAPVARHLGRGLVVVLAPMSAGARARLGEAVWDRVESEILSARLNDLRLQGRRYRAMGTDWPPPPQPAVGRVLRWLLAWAALACAAIFLPAARRRPWLAALAVTGVSLLFARLFLDACPARDAHTFRAHVRVLGETGSQGPALEEELYMVTPFGAAAGRRPKLRLAFSGLLPPRLLAAHAHELAAVMVVLEKGPTGGRLILRNASAAQGPIRRGVPLLFSRTGLGPGGRPPRLVLREDGAQLSVILPDTDLPVLHDALLRTRERTLALDVFAGRSLAEASRPSADRANAPRHRLMRLLAGEHRPGPYATLMGWEEPRPDEDGMLGTLCIYGLTAVLRTQP